MTAAASTAGADLRLAGATLAGRLRALLARRRFNVSVPGGAVLRRFVSARRTLKRAAAALVLLVLLPCLALVIAAAATPFPAPLRHPSGKLALRVVDRHGRTIRELRADGELRTRVRLADVSPSVPAALVAAEDARFRWHPGVDPLAIARAVVEDAWHRRIESGASTITQQLARTLFDRPRTIGGKLREMALALRIEASLSKDQILEQYLNRVEFGPNLRGIDAASRFYFDKPPRDLDLAEAATLVAIPRGPTLYDPRRGTERVRRRRDRILERMRDHGLAPGAAIDHALTEPITLHAGLVEGGAWQLVRGLADGTLEPALFKGRAPELVESTIDLDLQREVEELVKKTAARVADFDATAAAAVVVDNASGEVLAYVGSPDFFDAKHLGQNDGARALRQPGSTLKPFLYALAMERLGYTAATLLPDVELHLPTQSGDYAPRNYDGIFHGPVRVRQALGSSLNVPAVYTASRVGPEQVLDLLHELGFASLGEAASHYGPAIALGDGEVRLTELAGAYATLARGGLFEPLHFARYADLAGGGRVERGKPAPVRVIDAQVVAVLDDVLSDDDARLPAFGPGNALELPFPVAAKTGTSKGYRDNWAVGYTHEVTVAVWVGNFDGSPMHGSSGVTGAGPLFHDVMLAAMRGRERAPLVDHTGLELVEVCALSGKRAGPDCPHRMEEWFRPGHAPTETCAMHERVAVDPGNGLRAGPACRDAVERVFERYPARFTAWATTARRPLAPEAFSPRCRGRATPDDGALSVEFPFDGARFAVDPGVPASEQSIVLAARAPGGANGLDFILDGRKLGRVRAPFRLPWRLAPGKHELVVEAASGATSEPVAFLVR